MKLFIITVLVALTSAKEWHLKTLEEYSQLHKSCNEQYNIPLQLKQYHGKYPPKEIFEPVLCVLRGVEVWSDKDGFSVDRIMVALKEVSEKQKIDKQFLRESLEKCVYKNMEKSPALDWAYRSFKCFKDNEILFNALKDAQFYKRSEGNQELCVGNKN